MKCRMRRLLWGVALGLVLGLNACVVTRPPDSKPMPAHPVLPSLPRIDTARALPNWRWIGIRKTGVSGCPQPNPGSGWAAQHLFFTVSRFDDSRESYHYADEEETARTKKLEAVRKEFLYKSGVSESDSRQLDGLLAEMDRFCVYQADSTSGRDPNRELPPEVTIQLERFDRDAMALSSTAEEGEMVESLAEQFGQQTGLQEGKGRPVDPRPDNTRLVFLDTQPTNEGVPLNSTGLSSLHGYTLIHLADHLVRSSSSTSRASLASRLALARTDPLKVDDPASSAPNTRNGGNVGMIADLAPAIEEEITNWRLPLDPDRRVQNLVLNLSLAWDPAFFGGLRETDVCQMTAPVQAVYHALEFASREGALVIAAAGNRTAGPHPTSGPLLPAGWEGKTFGGACCNGKEVRPLVYAVGGIQSNGLPLPNSRPGATPPRVAYADHAVVTNSKNEPTAILTGSSVAAAVTSAIAAVVWHYRPDLKAEQVMELLQRSGNRLEPSADFYFGQDAEPPLQAPRVRRISLCPALSRALAELFPNEPRLSCECWDPRPPHLLPPSIPSREIGSAAIFRENRRAPSGCRVDRIFSALSASEPHSFCPSDEMEDLRSEPWMFPQPDHPPCPNCALIPEPPSIDTRTASYPVLVGYVLEGDISEEWLGCSLSSPTLVLKLADTEGNSETRSLSIPTASLCARDHLRIRVPNFDEDGPFRILSASLSFGLERGGERRAVENPVLITR